MAVTHYLWDSLSDNILAEYDGEGNLLTQYTHEPTYHGPLISQCDRNGCTTYYHFDGQGSTRRLSDENEFLSEPLNYTAFGELLTPVSHLPPFLYIGELGYYFDHDIGYTYIRARTYAAWLGRWLSPDPAGFVDGPNLFEYANNSFVGRIDPSVSNYVTLLRNWRSHAIAFPMTQMARLIGKSAVGGDALVWSDAVGGENDDQQATEFDPIGKCLPCSCSIPNPTLKYFCHPLVNLGDKVTVTCTGNCQDALPEFPESIADCCEATGCFKEEIWECQAFVNPGPPAMIDANFFKITEYDSCRFRFPKLVPPNLLPVPVPGVPMPVIPFPPPPLLPLPPDSKAKPPVA